MEFSDGEKGIEDQGWKNENNMQKTYSLGLEKAGCPMLGLPLNEEHRNDHMQCAPQWEKGALLPAADHRVGSVNKQAN